MSPRIVVLLALAALAGCKSEPLVDGLPQDPACSSCHGSDDNAAPPRPASLDKDKTTRDVAVGAHQLHVRDGLAHQAFACTECHLTPATVDAPGHVDPGPAELTWGAKATLGGQQPAWDREAATCASTYCHGASLNAGGTRTAPRWTYEAVPAYMQAQTDESCSGCHGFPPPAPHVPNKKCGLCHAATVETVDGQQRVKLADGKHIDGELQVVAEGCNACHGNDENAAPPTDLAGGSDSTSRTVGAHQAHLHDSEIRKALSCEECHLVPAQLNDPEHLDDSPGAEVTFGALSRTRSLGPAWNGSTCSSTWCHGGALHGGSATEPDWTRADGTQDNCDSCHGYPPPLPHPQLAQCQLCHRETLQATGAIDVEGGKHIDGTIDASTACNGCHGSAASNAPPVDLHGETATTARGVGAHQKHLADGAIRQAVACSECHLVPATASAPGHMDTDLPVELTWGPLASAGGQNPSFDGSTCSSTWCHGSGLHGGGATQPVWTRVDGSQSSCASCHGYPPPAPHPNNLRCQYCHRDTVFADGTIDVIGGKHINGTVDAAGTACNACHGNATNAAPPVDSAGASDTALRSVGAHQAHLVPSPWHRDLACTECHAVPATVGEAGHIDSALPAELRFGPLATAQGSAPQFDGTSCSAVYCHGATTLGGSVPNPVWTTVDDTQDACGACHGIPPPAHYGSDCSACHKDLGPNLTFVDKTRHIDGVVDIEGGACNACHGSAANAAPPEDLAGNTSTSQRTVGAHQSHLAANSWHKQYACEDCHVVPTSVAAPGHLDASPAEVTFGALARTEGQNPAWNGTTCASTYCHGATVPGGSNKTPTWTTVNDTQDACGTCHGVPPPNHYGDNCGGCHPGLDASKQFVDGSKHVDGKLDVKGGACNVCHGSAANPAPPVDLSGRSDPAQRTVGAHQAHLLTSDWHRDIACTECHVVPTGVNDPGHLDSSPAELVWGPLARAEGQSPSWNGTTCASTYCHGATMPGGSNKTPAWTVVDGSQDGCGTCHGVPPPSHYGNNCGVCHPSLDASGAWVDRSLHVDGKVDVKGGACNVCHGNANNAAPPTDTAGRSDTAQRTVGAHQPHLADSTWHRTLGCNECHALPADVSAPGHLDAAPAELTWGATARADGATASFNGATCSNYCHGATMTGGTVTAPTWTKVDGTQDTCGACHGVPPPNHYGNDCSRCHPTVDSNRNFVDKAKHLDGILDLAGGTCNTCHGNATNAAPPKDNAGRTDPTLRTIGAHQAHLLPSTWRKDIACDECHRVPSTIKEEGHVDTAAPAELTWGPVATAKGATPTWDGTTCANVYCHGAKSRGGTLTAPRWTVLDGSQDACGTCHATPPANHYGAMCWGCHKTLDASGNFADKTLHIDGVVQASGACDACHDAPPATGAHLAHFGAPDAAELLTYGDLRALESYEPGGKPYYMFGCGNCHPTDEALHMNGSVQVSVTSTGAAAGSIKAQNTAAARYDSAAKTCSGVYCHSSGQQASFDAGGAQLTPSFKTTPAWNGTASLGCTGCHENPPRYPSGPAGSATANSHIQWSVENDAESGHFAGLMFSHGSYYWGENGSPITCQTCHAATVDPSNVGAANLTRDPSRPLSSGFYYLDTTGNYFTKEGADRPANAPDPSCTVCHTGAPNEPAAGAGKVLPLRHVNGKRDVVFDDRQTMPSYSWLAPNSSSTLAPVPAPAYPQWAYPSSTSCNGGEACTIFASRSAYNGQTLSFFLQNTYTDSTHPTPTPAYDSATKSCAYVGCHLAQGKPRWGEPSLGNMEGCRACHGFSF